MKYYYSLKICKRENKMAINLGETNPSIIGTKIAGDLGNIIVTENNYHEDDDEDKNCDKQIATRTNTSNIPTNLVQNTVPVFGKVTVDNSENVQFGNNTYFNGPVTIKQIIQKNEIKEGIASVPQPQKKVDRKPLCKEQILLWHKITFTTICITIIGGIVAVVYVLQNKTEQGKGSQAQIDYNPSVSSINPTVEAYCFDNFQVIMILFLLPLTLTIFYSLLTKHLMVSGTRRITWEDKVHPNCLGKFCIECNEKDEPLLIAPDHLRIVSRTDWLAQPVEKPLNRIKQPVPWVIITHTATENCYNQSQCVLRVRIIQTFHIESRGWDDIGYNFLVGGDGSVYFGRGWDYEGAHTKGYNKYSIGIAFIGTFNYDPPSKQQVEACEKIIKQGVQLGKIAKDYKLFAHRQLMSTLSPGDKVFNIIKTWPHFTSNFTDMSSLIPQN